MTVLYYTRYSSYSLCDQSIIICSNINEHAFPFTAYVPDTSYYGYFTCITIYMHPVNYNTLSSYCSSGFENPVHV